MLIKEKQPSVVMPPNDDPAVKGGIKPEPPDEPPDGPSPTPPPTKPPNQEDSSSTEGS